MTRRTPRLLVALLVALAIVSACSTAEPEVANQLPDIELERVDRSGTYAVAGAGHARVLNLWATWCTPCRAELPAIDAVAAGTDIEIVGVNVGDSGTDAADLIAELGLSFAQVLDPTAQVQRALKITGMPSTVFVDADGQVAQIHSGELTEAEFEQLVDELASGTIGGE